MLAKALLAVVHHGSDLRQVSPAIWVRQLGNPFGPGALRLRQQRVDTLPDPDVHDAGDVSRAGQVTRGDRRAGDLGWIKSGRLGQKGSTTSNS